MALLGPLESSSAPYAPASVAPPLAPAAPVLLLGPTPALSRAPRLLIPCMAAVRREREGRAGISLPLDLCVAGGRPGSPLPSDVDDASGGICSAIALLMMLPLNPGTFVMAAGSEFEPKPRPVLTLAPPVELPPEPQSRGLFPDSCLTLSSLYAPATTAAMPALGFDSLDISSLKTAVMMMQTSEQLKAVTAMAKP